MHSFNYNCPKIPSPKKIKEGVANFLKIYPQYTNYYNNLYDLKNLAGGQKEKVIFWPPCHTIKVFADTNDKGAFKIEGKTRKHQSDVRCNWFWIR